MCAQAFTGKPARGLHNTPSRLLQDIQSQLPTTAYGLVNGRGFYTAAAQAGFKDCCMQLCGQGYPLCRTGPAAEIVAALLAEADEAAQQLCAGSAS
jgi:nitronate monooxygenase